MELTFSTPWYRRLLWRDWLFAALLALGAGWVFQHYAAFMDEYEKAILFGAVPALAWLGWQWRRFQILFGVVIALALWALSLYGGEAGQLANAEKVFGLKYLFSSQSAILWMCALFFLATITYWIGLLGRAPTASWVGSALTWAAVVMGWLGLLVRWYESYLISPDVGHIPISNLYEVFVLFSLITALFYLYYEQRYDTRSLGGFALLVISSAVVFLLWYTFDRQASDIQPLVPALQSWWMKLHVPANFIGYGTFSLAAMIGLAALLKAASTRQLWIGLILLPAGLFAVPVFLYLLFGAPTAEIINSLIRASSMLAVLFGFFASTIFLRTHINLVTPTLEIMDDWMYKAIAVGFAFFTVATILGALWAADAWGTYWQWDPKETWALIVWLNYAAWLHLRLMKGLRGTLAAWWALVGLIITTFAFLGVNMFLSGLHSYGNL